MERKQEKISLETLRKRLPIKEIGLIIFDLEKDYSIDTTGYAHQAFGYTMEELLTPGFWEQFIHPDYYEKFKLCMKYAHHARKGEVWHQDLEILDKQKVKKWLKMNFKLFSWDSNNKPLTVGIEIRDISILIEMEKDLKIKAEALHNISYKYSHKVRGPVASILGLIQLIKMEENDDTKEKIFEHLYAVVQKLDDIIFKVNREAEK